MTIDTSLAEVARHLGAETAIMVDRQEARLQTIVLMATRSYMMVLESQGVIDPITFQERVHKFVEAYLMAYKGERYA